MAERVTIGKTYKAPPEFTRKYREKCAELEYARDQNDVVKGRGARGIASCKGDLRETSAYVERYENECDDLLYELVTSILKAEGIELAELVSASTMCSGLMVHIQTSRKVDGEDWKE